MGILEGTIVVGISCMIGVAIIMVLPYFLVLKMAKKVMKEIDEIEKDWDKW